MSWSVPKFLDLQKPAVASPPWRLMAASVPGESPSCIRPRRKRRPHSGTVRNLFAVDWSRYSGLAAWGMPSPVPTSCSRKSLYGWITALPRNFGRVAHPCVLCKGGIPECEHYRILILIFPSLRLGLRIE
jgi:hypothetical protein